MFFAGGMLGNTPALTGNKFDGENYEIKSIKNRWNTCGLF